MVKSNAGEEKLCGPKDLPADKFNIVFLKTTLEGIVRDSFKHQASSDLLRFGFHEAVFHISNSLDLHLYTLAIFMDLEKAFCNVSAETIFLS